MAATPKGRNWEIRNSIWIVWTFTFFFNWIAFLYIGVRVRRRRWIYWGVLYSLPFILAMITAESPIDSWQTDVAFSLMLGLGIMSIIHAFQVRKEYLMRLETLQQSRVGTDAALRQRIQTEYSSGAQGSTSSSGVGQPSSNSLSPAPQPRITPPAQPSGFAAPEPSPVSTIDLNSASEQEIASLPGVGLIIAKRAVSLRESRGGFRSVEDFGQALNLRPHVVERITPLVSISTSQQPGGSDPSGRVVDF